MAKLFIVAVFFLFAGCSVQSDFAKRSIEKYGPTPTPSISPTPTPVPIDPGDVVTVDTSVVGERIGVNGNEQKKTEKCDKYNPLAVNGSRSTVTVSGTCSQIQINGDSNTVTAEGVMEIVFNGSGNKVTYSKFPNSKNPVVIKNRPDNTVEKVAAAK